MDDYRAKFDLLTTVENEVEMKQQNIEELQKLIKTKEEAVVDKEKVIEGLILTHK